MYDNVLFLDVDGVLNSGPWLMLETQKSKDFHRRTDMDIDAMSLDPEAVARLQRIVDATGAKIVLSSSWRYMYQPKKFMELLRAHGFVGDLIGATPLSEEVPGRKCRGDEVAMWLKEYSFLKIKKFVILDDDEKFGDLEHRLVRTSFECGLTDSNVESVISLFVS